MVYFKGMALHTPFDFSGVAEKVPERVDKGGGIKKQGGIKKCQT